MPPAIPLHVLDRPEAMVKLMDAPCVDPETTKLIVGNLPPEFHDKFRAIESTWLEKDGSRKDYAGCWLPVTPEMAGVDGFFLVFSDGTSGVVPMAEFRKVRGGTGV